MTTIFTPPSISAEKRERQAWLVLLGTFSICVLLAVAVPTAAYIGYHSWTVGQRASLQSTSGTARLEVAGQRDPLAVPVGSTKADVVAGTRITTDSRAQALLTLADRSTLTIFPNSVMQIDRMERPRFNAAAPMAVTFTVLSGRVRVQIAPMSADSLDLTIHTPHAPAPQGGIALGTPPFASYGIEVASDATSIAVRSGAATVAGQTGGAVALAPGQRAEIPLGAAVRGPFAAQRNLIANSDLQNPEVARPISSGVLVERWLVTSDQGGDGGDVDGTVEINTLGSSRAMHFERIGSNNNHGETAVYQPLGRIVSDYVSLTLRLDATIVSQSLGGGGEQSSEFPLMVRIDYTDVNGNPQHWTHGFYCQNPLGYNILNGSELPCGTRRTVEFDLRAAIPLAQRLDQIKLYASGWDWESYASDIELIAE